MSDEPVQHAGDQIPMLTGSDGQAYIPATAVIQLLRAISASCTNLADDPDCDLHGAAAAVDIEADAIECRAIRQTR
ncbi:hypothetical protein [Streptomyces cinereoruber]|uniref:hypothetical protein n=1 Tax=Streptomyces cinereoruber TaxID=67260 RepID=UPI00362AA2DB